ncbi:hypothetical protein LWI29_019021 [Acer saccharum]|uniref:Uncharacterized protein n=1 Tax=Acer saccharum TaxID=4024 RepID=A0AA39VW65_ACESA|nr:hypothetical protein LWI29_019021 [Acer saccharum]
MRKKDLSSIPSRSGKQVDHLSSGWIKRRLQLQRQEDFRKLFDLFLYGVCLFLLYLGLARNLKSVQTFVSFS